MIKRFCVLALGIVGIAAGGPLHAEDEIGNGLYAQVGIGPTFFGSDRSGLQGDSVTTTLDTGFSAGAAIGYRFSSFRVEVAGDYHRGEVDQIKISGTAVPVKGGNLALVTVMANGYIDLDLGFFVAPYAGFGIGAGVLLADETGINAAFKVDDDAAVFTWNAMGGLNWTVTEHVQVMTGYRYVSTTEGDLKVKSAVVGAATGKMDSSVEAHELVIAVRYNF